MTLPNIENPRYSEEEVWDLLSSYLEKKHNAYTVSIQRGIYADYYRDGSIFSVDNSEDEFATLYCFRNLHFNISGSIVYQLDSHLSEDFTLQHICEYLRKPFPKALDEHAGLTNEQKQERQENIRIARQRKKHEELMTRENRRNKYTSIALLYAFEYQRAVNFNERVYHYDQVTRSVLQSNFFKLNQLNYPLDGLVINANQPTLEEYLEFIDSQKEFLIEQGCEFSVLKEVAEKETFPSRLNFFSNEARKMGSLLFPMRDLNGRIVSALNIIDLTKSVDNKEFLFIKNEANTIGTVHFTETTETDPGLIFLTVRFEVASVLKELFPNHPIHAALSIKNLIDVLKQILRLHPDSLVIVVLDNDYIQLAQHKNINAFRNGSLSTFAQFLNDNVKDTFNIGLLMPEFDIEQNDNLGSFHEIYCELGLIETTHRIHAAISELIERRNSQVLEINHLIEAHLIFEDYFRDTFDIAIPDISITELGDHQQADSLLTQADSGNSILLQESKSDFIAWLNMDISPEIKLKESLIQNKAAMFAKSAAMIDSDEAQAILDSKTMSKEANTEDEIF